MTHQLRVRHIKLENLFHRGLHFINVDFICLCESDIFSNVFALPFTHSLGFLYDLFDFSIIFNSVNLFFKNSIYNDIDLLYDNEFERTISETTYIYPCYQY